jgi:hypothetical protein
VIAALAACAGRLIPAENDIVGLLASVGASSAAWVVLSWIFMREELRGLVALTRAHLLPGRRFKASGAGAP